MLITLIVLHSTKAIYTFSRKQTAQKGRSNMKKQNLIQKKTENSIKITLKIKYVQRGSKAYYIYRNEKAAKNMKNKLDKIRLPKF